MDRIAELQELIARGKAQRTQAHKLRLRPLVQSINHDLRNWTEELHKLNGAQD